MQTKRVVSGVVILATLGLTAGKKPAEIPAVGPTVVPAAGMFLRSGFDTDPSMFLGRFLPTGTNDIDESNAMQLTCSQYIGYRKIDAGGVAYDEVFAASTAVSARIGIPLVVGVSVGHSASSSVRVQYVLTSKMVAEIADPAAFETCCKQAPDQCTDRLIGEFYEGTGQVFYASASDTGGKGRGATLQVAGEVEMKNGVAWAKSVTFTRPVYFAFKTTPNLWTGAQVGGCGDWVQAPPKSTQGHYFVGMSDPRTTEASAREAALADARVQTVRYAGTNISSGTVQVTMAAGDRAALQETLSSQAKVDTASQGVAKFVKDEAWCVTPMPTPQGEMFVAKVLGFLPKESEAAVAQAVATAATP